MIAILVTVMCLSVTTLHVHVSITKTRKHNRKTNDAILCNQ